MAGTFENPQQIIRSWGLQGSFASGAVVQDKLVPARFTRIRTPFLQTWREEALNSSLDWGVQSFSYYLPESLRVISSMFLKIVLPAISGTSYKANPGLYAVKTIRFLSAGQEAYHCDVAQYLRDYLESLSDEHYTPFTKTYLGNQGSATTAVSNGVTRTLLIPILLPNSAYMNRSGFNTRGRGIWPCLTGNNRLEVQITMAPNTDVCEDASNLPASISGACSVLFHQVDMTSEDVLKYSDARGAYSVISRRFTEVTNGYQAATANTKVSLTTNQPIGCVTELICIAQAQSPIAAHREVEQNVHPIHFAIISDSVTQKSLNNKEKVEMELWTNGFVGNSAVNPPARLCFAAHASESESMYSGGYNMQLSSQITVEVTFPSTVDFRIFAVQLQRISISPLGLVQSSLD